jgi:hypothetical protein
VKGITALAGVAVLALCFSAISAYAEVAPNWEFGAGLELIANYNYHESKLMRLDGTQFGAYGLARYFFRETANLEPLSAELFLSYVGGDITYDGARGDTPTKGDVGNSIVNIRGLAGWTFGDITLFDIADFKVTPYSGLCYRYLVNHLEDLSGGGGYQREQSYLYWPLGLGASFPLPSDERFTLGCKMEFDILLHGAHETSKGLSREFTQDSGYGFRIAPDVRFDINEQLALTLDMFWRYWSIGESDVDEGYREPENSTSEFGFSAGVLF